MSDINAQMERWFRGNADALDFSRLLWEAMQSWDDLEDEGRTDHNPLISWLTFGKEYHPYFMQYGHILRPVMLGVYLQWRASNVLDRGDRLDVAKSYMLRAGIYNLYHVMAWIEGGDEWAAEVGPEIYRAYGETPEEIWQEFNDA